MFIFKTTLLLSHIGSKKSETAPERQPVAEPWCGSFLSVSKRQAAGRPEPLWRPACEEEERVRGPSSEVSKPSVSKLPQGDTSPPSPRTLKAIQAAMNGSSDEENMDRVNNGESLSPRTLLAIQQALSEEEHGSADQGTLISSSPVKLQMNIHHPAPQVVISSSEEKPEADNVNFLPHGKSDLTGNPTNQSFHVKESLFDGSSEDDLEEVIGQRNKALRFVLLKQPHESDMKSEEETGQLREEIRTGSRGQTEKHEDLENRAGLITKNGDLAQPQGAAASSQDNSSFTLSAQLCGKLLNAETETHPDMLEQRRNKSVEVPGERTDVTSQASEASGSEGTVIFQTIVQVKLFGEFPKPVDINVDFFFSVCFSRELHRCFRRRI